MAISRMLSHDLYHLIDAIRDLREGISLDLDGKQPYSAIDISMIMRDIIEIRASYEMLENKFHLWEDKYTK